MIELTIRVPDDLAQTIGDLVKRIPDAEILYSVEDLKTETLRDECAKETFNDLLNSYYTQNRHKEIILFSNTVSSIDKRRRFIVDGQAVLKIRIIKKN